jgi:carboxyl-terminal processing protease
MKFAPYSRAAMLAGVLALLPATTAGLAAVDARSGPQFNKLIAIYQLIKANYVEPVSDDKLIKGAIDGMLSSLDPHSAYLDGASLQRLETMIDGRYSGLGLSVMMDDGAVKIISPMRGSPAEKAGLKAGDFITHLDGKLQYGGDIDEAVSKMRGEAGTSIRLTIFRPGRDEPFDVTVTRGVIDLKPVTSKFENGIGVISVNEFSRNVGTQVMAEIQGMRQQQGTRLSGLVLDLRSNPGGSLDEAVALSDLFLTSGTIVSQRGRVASENEYYRAESMIRGDGARGLPLVVLIDAGSASASEIVAGALQDNKRAVIMGERSFGKGSVQQMISLDRTSAIKITTARYYTPLGKSVQEGGIEPDIRVPQISDPDMRKRAERQMRESDLRGHLINEISLDEKQLETDKQDDPRFKMTAAELQAKGIKDFQLYYAIETLRRTSPSVVAARRP